MIDLPEANHIEIVTDATGKVWVNVDEKCQLRIGKVASLQLRYDNNQYISKGKDGIFIVKRHTVNTCWCGVVHPPPREARSYAIETSED